MTITTTVEGVEYTLEKINKYLKHRIHSCLADGTEDNQSDNVARIAYKFLPYIIVSAPNCPQRVKCDLDGIPAQKIDPLWVAENIEGFTAMSLLKAVLDAATPSEHEAKN